MYMYLTCAQYRMYGADSVEVAPGIWPEVREMLKAAPETGFATIRGVRFFIGKKRNFGIDFAQLPAGEDRFVYVVDGASEQQLKECTMLSDWEKLDDGVYRIRYIYTNVSRRLLRVIHAVFAGIFALLMTVCAVTLAAMIIKLRSVIGGIS